MSFLESTMLTLQQWEWLGILIARLAVGLLFAISGYGKIFVAEKRAQMQETMESAGVSYRCEYYPEDANYLLEFEPTVTHYEVLA